MRIGLRRALFAGLTMATAAMLLVLATMALAPGRWSGLDIALLLLFSMTVPWAVIGFWNAVIGLVVMRLAADSVAAVFPAEGDADDEPLTGTTAILVCIRNEQAAQVIRNLEPMMAGLARLRLADHFAVYILSDTDDVALAAEEERAFGSFSQRWRDAIAVTYRRRMNNDGFKAGNIRDFCERFGAHHDFAIPLDADSIMPAQAVVKLVRLMQRNPPNRHPAKPGDRISLHQRLHPHLSVRHAARHALLYGRQRVVAGGLADPIGAITPSCDLPRSSPIAGCRCWPAAVPCSAMIRSRRC
jgi:membrane glycosyltransferase